LDVACKRTATP